MWNHSVKFFFCVSWNAHSPFVVHELSGVESGLYNNCITLFFGVTIFFALVISLTKWCCMLICLIRLWWIRFLINVKLPWLSLKIIVASFCGKPNSSSNFMSHMASLMVHETTMYFASINERATSGCFLLT